MLLTYVRLYWSTMCCNGGVFCGPLSPVPDPVPYTQTTRPIFDPDTTPTPNPGLSTVECEWIYRYAAQKTNVNNRTFYF